MHAFIHSKTILLQLYTALGQVVNWRVTAFEEWPFVIEYRGNLCQRKESRLESAGILHPYSQRRKSKQELKVLPRASCGSEDIKNNNQKVATTSALRAVISMTDRCPGRTSVILLMAVISEGSNYKTHTHSACSMTWESAHDVWDEKRKPQNRMCVCGMTANTVQKKKVHICIEKALKIKFKTLSDYA